MEEKMRVSSWDSFQRSLKSVLFGLIVERSSSQYMVSFASFLQILILFLKSFYYLLHLPRDN